MKRLALALVLASCDAPAPPSVMEFAPPRLPPPVAVFGHDSIHVLRDERSGAVCFVSVRWGVQPAISCVPGCAGGAR